MSEQILKTMMFPRTYRRVALTNDSSYARDFLSYKNGEKCLSLKEMRYNGSLTPWENRFKVYTNYNEIVRAAGSHYCSQMPRGGNGQFCIDDNGIHLLGKLKNGCIANIKEFSKRDKDSFLGIRNLLYGNGLEHVTRHNVEEFLDMANKGELKLQNLTKVMLKKVLAFLPK